MPADVVGAFQAYIEDQLSVLAWEGEIPRYDPQGNPIVPGIVGQPPNWPVIQVKMPEGAMDRGGSSGSRTFEDPYHDDGPLHIRVWGTTRASVLDVLTKIETLLNSISNLRAIPFNPPGPAGNPYYVIDAEPQTWSCFQEEEVRTMDSQLLYQGQWNYVVSVHGAVPSA